MARPRSPNRDKAKEIWLKSGKKCRLKDITAKLGVSEQQIRKWKNIDEWDKVTLLKENGNVTKHKGAPVGNKNALGNNGGAPIQNKNAEKHGFFSKYLPEETFSIIQEIEKKDPLDILWENIQIAYAAIVRAQQIMHVKDHDDKTIEKVEEKKGKDKKIIGEKWEVQEAWDKQATFLKAQARAQAELRSLIKQYDELLHSNYELANEEQKARIEQIRAKTMIMSGTSEEEIADDGFLKALDSSAAEDWKDEETSI